jgi:hypothetical protein
MTGAVFGTRGIDFGLYFFRSEGRCIQRVELGEGLAQALGSRIACALLAEHLHGDLLLGFQQSIPRLDLLLQQRGELAPFIQP